MACWLVDSRIPLQGAQFPFPRPAHKQVYPILFTDSTHFQQTEAAICFDSSYLKLPILRDENALQHMLQRALPLTVFQYSRDRLLMHRVRQLLIKNLIHAHNADTLAQALNVSARTLHRQLKEEGTSLQSIKDDVRLKSAKTLLQRSDRPLKQVAEATGFLNEKSFIRAFRNWTGMTPGEFRELPHNK